MMNSADTAEDPGTPRSDPQDDRPGGDPTQDGNAGGAGPPACRKGAGGLVVEQVSLSYRGRAESVQALREVSLRVAPGEVVAVAGPSGSGKTTLLLTAGSLLRPDTGRVLVGGRDVYAQAPAQRERLRHACIGFVFQQFHLVPYLTVRENVLAPCVAGPVHEPGARADRLLRRFGLATRAEHLPHELSTGERQRTALARALLADPGIILADEPTGNLDDDNGRAVITHLADAAAAGRAVLIVTHDSRVTDIAHRTLTIREGRLASQAALAHKA
jgi:putative ABC transport system ATP-binding protein